jgi:hypothetical protein
MPNYRRRVRAKTDRFGNDVRDVACKNNKNGFPVGFVYIAKAGVYKLEPTKSDKENVDLWIRVTKKKQVRTEGAFTGRPKSGGFRRKPAAKRGARKRTSRGSYSRSRY